MQLFHTDVCGESDQGESETGAGGICITNGQIIMKLNPMMTAIRDAMRTTNHANEHRAWHSASGSKFASILHEGGRPAGFVRPASSATAQSVTNVPPPLIQVGNMLLQCVQ